MIATIAEIEKFLQEFKQKVEVFDIIFWDERGKNTDALAQLDIVPTRRKEIITRYDNAFMPLGVKTLKHYTDNHQSSGHLYITRVPDVDATERNEIIRKMAELGVACNVHYKPLPMHTAYKNLGFDIKDYPNAYDNFKNEITLPLHTCLTDEQVEYIIECYTKVLKEYIK